MEAFVLLALIALMVVVVARVAQERPVQVRVPVRAQRQRTTPRR